MINVFQPTLGAEELEAVGEAFAAGWVGRGPRTARFEQSFARHVAVDDAQVTAIGCATAGLFLAMELLGVEPGSDVVLPSISFVGAANAVAARGARPRFCDVDARTLNPTVEHVEAALTARTRAVVLLHYGGYPGDVAGIAELCRARGIALVEDAACAVASTAGGRACGTFGDIGVWSFDAMKVLVTGDGGMLYARDPALAREAARRAYLGLEQPSGLSQAAGRARWWEFDVASFSGRHAFNDIAAAIGNVQLGKLAAFVERRRAIAERYDELFAGADRVRRPPRLEPGHSSTYYLYWIQVDDRVRDRLAERLLEAGIYTTFRYHPLHRVRAYASSARLPGSESAAARTLCLPLHQGLSDADVDMVARSTLDALAAAGGRAVPASGTP
jgi:aminotransferase